MLARLGALTATLLGLTLLAFFLIRLAPGDPVSLLVGERGADAQQLEAAKHALGLDQPLARQYGSFVARALHGDLGQSIVSGRPVAAELGERWPATIELVLAAVALALALGIPAGVWAAVRRGSVADHLVNTVALVGYSMPVFWLGLLLILLLSVQLGLTPVSGRLGVEFEVPPVTGLLLVDALLPAVRERHGLAALGSALQHLLLPALTLAVMPMAVFARMTRASMLEVLGEDFIRAAWARGLSRRRVIWVHALRNALLPVITVGGLFFVSAAVAGSILVESLFGWPGLGSYLVGSVQARDYPVIQGAIVVVGLLVLATNAAVEGLYRAANPRLRG
ncbi:ABC transporter permease [Azohydromonas caseinilytica]|uniref:ABC transporter permease n=1 Tax=Azohydromonas caseinilytica TaxID=2728836 RepID=A0A848FIB9_9BURK|nr:ABC transporter permease [Azohydromonas caseinilytica]NML18019.1 ABC transporter permease [Azohydromonas caseinilytica]